MKLGHVVLRDQMYYYLWDYVTFVFPGWVVTAQVDQDCDRVGYGEWVITKV